MLFRSRMTVFLLTVVALSCRGRQETVKDSEKGADHPYDLPTPTPVVTPQPTYIGPTFYGDVLPILTSTAIGRNYRCTVCHADYKNYASASLPNVAIRIVTSARERTMPVSGDVMSAADVAVLQKWFDLGRVAGTPVPSPTPTSEGRQGT